MKPSKETDASKLPPRPLPPLRAPMEKLAGCLWLARLTDKARLESAGRLPEDYRPFLGHPRGVDGRFLKHFELSRKETLGVLGMLPGDEAVEQWFLSQSGVSGESIREWNVFAPNIGRVGQPGEKELRWLLEHFFAGTGPSPAVASAFEAIAWDEQREA